MKPVLLLPLILCACSPPGVSLDRPADDSAPPLVDETAEPEDTAHDTEDIPDVDLLEQSAWLFRLDMVHQIEIDLGDEGWSALSAEPFEYVPAQVDIDGAALPEVAVRIKGRLGSYRDLSHKSAFKIDFNRYDAGYDFHGLEKLNLNNMVQDSSQVHERLSFELYRLAGVPTPRVGYGWVTVNGHDFGLYSLVEAYDDVFLAMHWAEPDGNLYDGDYVWYGDDDYLKLDFSTDLQDYMELDEGVDVGHADVHRVTYELGRVLGGDGFDEGMAEVLDIDAFVRMWVGDVWLSHYDSYSFNQNNFRVYFDPSDGLAELLPWDPDWAFYPHTPVASPEGLLSYGCKADISCHARFHELLDELCAAVPVSDLRDQLDQAVELIQPWVEADPRRELETWAYEAYQDDMRAWIDERCAVLESTGGL